MKNPKAPNLKTLPKTHKKEMTMRPIVNCREAPNYKVNKYLHKFLSNNIILDNQYTITNTKQIIKKLQKLKTTSNTKILSLDVTNLYTNIPIDETINIIIKKLNEAQLDNNIIQQITHLLKTSLKQNYFKFDNKIYIQSTGLAMGDPLSGYLANIFLQELENKHINNLNNKFNFSTYARYVDDTIIIYENTQNKDSQILEEFNKWHQNIKFTLEQSNNNSLNFLDLNITIATPTITFNIYRKETTTTHAIKKHSIHPITHKISKFRFLIDRLLTTPLNRDNYNKELNYIKQIAFENGYENQLINNLIQKRKTKLHKKEYTTLQPEKTQNKKQWHSLTYYGKITNKLSNFFKKQNINIAPRTNNKLNNIIPNNTNHNEPLLNSGIYQLNCKNCTKTYIGQTRRNFKIRFKEHTSDFVYNRNRSKFAQHLIEENHELANINDTLKILKITNDPTIETAEQFHIIKEHNSGKPLLNEQIANINNPLFNLLKLLPPKQSHTQITPTPPLLPETDIITN
ncbi:metacaspase-2-like [Periplaneta americana]|uniref:metacaspase-2-like n=1 Tax=Periplaneta americana TaxID=6978 RepID=UPI0037E97122